MLAAVLKDFQSTCLGRRARARARRGRGGGPDRSCGFCATDYKAIKGIRRNVDVPLRPGPRAGGRRGRRRARACGTSTKATK